MKAWRIVGYGAIADGVRMHEVPVPQPGPRDMLIRVAAASINPIDYKIVQGELKRVLRLAMPAPFGFDAAGTVESVGSEARKFRKGDAVFVRAPRDRMGSFAEYMVASETHVARRPSVLNAAEAASLPLVALTTVQALVDRAKARPGQRILIHAGSGGLGSFAIQYAHRVLGLHVATTTSSRNAEWVGALGADRVICYDREDYLQDAARYDIVFDTLGGNTTADSFRVVKPGGVVVSVAGPPDRDFARQVGAGPLVRVAMHFMNRPIYRLACQANARYFRFLTESDGAQLDRIAAVVESGKVRPVIDRSYPFLQLVQAMEAVAAGRSKGKVVLEW